MFGELNRYLDTISVKHPQKARFMRYAFFGGLSTAIDLLLFYVLIEFFDVSIKVALVGAFLIAVLLHYLFVHAWVYTGPFYGSSTSRYINFFIVNALGFFLTVLFFRFFVKLFHPDTKLMLLVVRALVSILVGVLGYLVNTIHVFKKR